jgi:hypothetical protein
MDSNTKSKKWLGVGMLALLLSLTFSLGVATGINVERNGHSNVQEEQLSNVSVKIDEINHMLIISAHSRQP